jgi:hypothetical protein
LEVGNRNYETPLPYSILINHPTFSISSTEQKHKNLCDTTTSGLPKYKGNITKSHAKKLNPVKQKIGQQIHSGTEWFNQLGPSGTGTQA